MEDVKWLEVTLDTTEAELDALCARLTGNVPSTRSLNGSI